MEHKEHHIWCDYFYRLVEGCPTCRGLREEYPEGDLAAEELIRKAVLEKGNGNGQTRLC
jgi:hypothetical protein